MDTRQCASEDAGLEGGVDWGVSHRLEKEASASEDAGPRKRVDREIPHWLGRRMEHSL